jgi:ABC-type transport system involved in cytochrome c biogenesis permease subunit
MSKAIKHHELMSAEIELNLPENSKNLLPVIAPLALAFLFIVARAYSGPGAFLNEGALTLLALISYISAAVILVTNIFVKERVLDRLGMLTVAVGVCFNFSGWMIRWIEAGEAEGWKRGINGVWRYFPLDNLYPLTLGFCFGAAATTLVIIRKPKYQFLGALSMPLVTVILTVAMMLGNDISTLPPILDSYWRPIHVSVATIGYGICLVSFGLAFAYLLKDGVRSEAIAIAVALFGLLVYFTIGRYGIPSHAEYSASVYIGKSSFPLRATLPGVGPLMALTLFVISASLALFTIDWLNRNERAKRLAWNLFRSAVVLQAIVLGVLFYQLRGTPNAISRISETQYSQFGQWLSTQMQIEVPPEHYVDVARDWMAQNSAKLTVGMRSNPVEIGGLIGLFVALFLVALFAAKRGAVTSALPPLAQIDALLYRTVSVAFPLLSLLLITGAVWANESWGRYWGWDSKEVGALVAWMAYAGFLHTRIAHGWRGRRSAYFALLGFVLVIFTWLGVSFLLPGLHSYA